MIARPIIAVSPDKRFGNELAGALHVAGPGRSVSIQRTLHAIDEGDFQHALVVVHVSGEVAAELPLFLPRFAGESRIIAVLPRAGLGAIVQLMQASQRVAGMLVEEDFEPRQLSTLATRALSGDLFGLDKQLPPGARIQTETIRDSAGKTELSQRILQMVGELVPRSHQPTIEQCVDEMLMNALYAAPVDEQGKRVFANISPRTRLGLKIPQEVVVQWACDGRTFAISVRDAFGSLPRQTVLNVLYKCLHDDQSVDSKASGAGVGLYLMVSGSSSVCWNVVPGVATEVTCTFDLTTPKIYLQELAFFLESRDVTGKLPADGTQKLTPRVLRQIRKHRVDAPPPSRIAQVAIGVAAVAGCLLVAYGIYSRATHVAKTAGVEVDVTPKGAVIELEGTQIGTATDGSMSLGELEIGRAYSVGARLDGYEPKQTVVQPHEGTNKVALDLSPVPATVELDSDPTGATVELDGKSLGGTPIALKSLPPGKQVTVVLKRAGYHDVKVVLDVPASGKSKKLVQKLEASDAFVKVHLVSNPSGARVYQLGPSAADLGRTYTPADLVVEAGKPVSYMLAMPGHAPLMIAPFTPARGVAQIEKGGELAPGSSLRVESAVEGKITVSSAPHCTNVDTPVDCPLARGAYTVEFTPAGGGAKQTKSVTIDNDLTLKF